MRPAHTQDITDIVRQWQGWLSVRGTDRWMTIVTTAARNAVPLKNRLGAPDQHELGDYARRHGEALCIATNQLLRQVRVADRLRIGWPPLSCSLMCPVPQITDTRTWWFSLARKNPWAPVGRARSCVVTM